MPEARGVFETILVRSARCVFAREHYERLCNAAARLGLTPPESFARFEELAGEAIKSAGVESGRLKFALDPAAGSGPLCEAWNFAYPGEWYSRGIVLARSGLARRDPESPFAGVKLLARRELDEARDEARSRGAQEALLLDTHGSIAEGAVSNVFWLSGGAVFTPSVACGILDGIVRVKVARLSGNLGIPVETGEYPLEAMLRAEEVFATNSLMGIMPVRAILGLPGAVPAAEGEGPAQPIASFAAPGPVTARLMAAYADLLA